MLTITKQDSTVITLPDPSSMTWGISDVEGCGSGVNQNGDEFKDVVNKKRTIQVAWGPLTQEEIEVILGAVEDTYFQLEYPDPEGGTITKTVGKTNISSPMLSNINNVPMWKSLKIKFKER